MSEFSLIKRFFTFSRQKNSTIIKGIGDDCAIIQPPEKLQLYISTDTLIEGVHFPATTSASDIAIKSLAVNISDLAAMGAKPAYYTLVLALPDSIDEQWIEEFSKALEVQSEHYAIELIGGDMSRSRQLMVTIQVHGYAQQGMLRDKAQTDEHIIVTGKLGAAALGLELVQHQGKYPGLSKEFYHSAIAALNRPLARIAEAQWISRYAKCAIDISDGLLADLGHILEQSHCGALLELEKIPLADCLSIMNKEQALLTALTGGDDYELCFTVSDQRWQEMKQSHPTAKNFHVIGKIKQSPDLELYDNGKRVSKLAGKDINAMNRGYNHFEQK